MSGETDLSELIRRVNEGDAGARHALFAAACTELRKLARSRLRDGGRNTMLDTMALVHESYLRFLQVGQLRSDDRRAFFAYASRVTRSVIIGTPCEDKLAAGRVRPRADAGRALFRA